jgi:putative oxygen-independent coproporphyrinogen III oxidase
VVGLYLHAPFCKKKCGYCHFYVLRDSEKLKAIWLQGIFRELEMRVSDQCFSSVYFGGGTPSLLGPGPIAQIMERLNLAPDCEVTLEANPEGFDPPGFREAGVNRISFGVQSFDDSVLRRLDRQHTAAQAIGAIESALPFGNISIDLMYEVPGLTREAWTESLTTAAALPIQHLSLYNLTFEPGTPFHRKRARLLPDLPSEADSLAMLQEAVTTLTGHGFDRYEISAFARDGKRSRHNTGYWLGRPFLGIGPSAFSYLDGRRFRNSANLMKWSQQLERGEEPIDYEERLSPSAREAELLAIGLRMKEGVPLPDLEIDLNDGLLEVAGDRLRLTEKGKLFYDTVASRIVE